MSHTHICRKRFPHSMDIEGSFLVDVAYNAGSSDPCCFKIFHIEAKYKETSSPLGHVFSDEALRNRHPHQSNHLLHLNLATCICCP